MRSGSPSTQAFPGAEVAKERLSAKRPKRNLTPPRRHTTPTTKTDSVLIESTQEEAVLELALTPEEKFVNFIAENQLDTPTRSSYPRQPHRRVSSNSMKRISAPVVPLDPINEKTPAEIAKRNRSTNIFQVFDQLDGEKTGLDDIHEEHVAPVSLLSKRSEMKSVQDLVWSEERHGNGSPVSRSCQQNSMKSVQDMVYKRQGSPSPTPKPSQRNSMKSVQENPSPPWGVGSRNSTNDVQIMVWQQGNGSSISRSSQRSSTYSIQDMVSPKHRKRISKRIEELVRSRTGQVVDEDPMSSQEGSIFTGSQNSPLSIRDSTKIIEVLFRRERDVEFRRQMKAAGFVLDPDIEKQAMVEMVSSATDHVEAIHSSGNGEEYISEGRRPSNPETSAVLGTSERPSEQTEIIVAVKGEEDSETTNIELMDCAIALVEVQPEDTESTKKQAGAIPTDEADKEHSTTSSPATDIEHMDCAMASKDSQAEIIIETEPEELNDEAQPRPSVHTDERGGGLDEPAQDTVLLPPTIEQRDFAFVDKAIRRNPVGSGISRPLSPADTSVSNMPCEGAEKPGLYNLDSKFPRSKHRNPS